MKRSILFLILFLFVPWSIYAASTCSWVGNTGTVASPYAVTDFSSCVTDATGKTGAVIINIPAASVTWGTGVNVNMTTWTNVTGLTINGAGQGTTTINSSGALVVMTFTSPSGKSFKVSNFSLTGGATLKVDYQSKSTTWNIDSVTFTSPDTLFIQGIGSGVISRCTFSSSGVAIHVMGHNPTASDPWMDSGNYSWGTASVIGTANANAIIEGNTFLGCGNAQHHVIDAEYGATYALRWNTFSTGCGASMHDALYSRAVRSWEVIYNKFDNTGMAAGSMTANFAVRGGTGIFANNQIINGAAFDTGHPVEITNYRSCGNYDATGIFNSVCDNTAEKGCFGSSSSATNTKVCTTDADCGGESGACQNLDGNTGGNGYPCRDQVGRGANQTLEPAYFWGNTVDGGAMTAPLVYNQAAGDQAKQACIDDSTWTATYHIVLDRDYYNSAKSGYSYSTCPDPRTGLTGSCDTATKGATGYNMEGVSTPTSLTGTLLGGSIK